MLCFGQSHSDEVTVKNTVTKAMVDAIEQKTATEPTLTFTAYAVQKANVDTAAAAWNIVENATFLDNAENSGVYSDNSNNGVKSN